MPGVFRGNSQPTACYPSRTFPDLSASPALGPQFASLEDSLSLLTQTVLITHSGGLFSSVWAETVTGLLPFLQTEGWVGKEMCVWGQEEHTASVLNGVPSPPLHPPPPLLPPLWTIPLISPATQEMGKRFNLP